MIVIYLSIAFEWKMAVAAFVALIHDIVITVGVYSLFGFTVSPASVIGLLTILGYSLYDTVVVFDKVRENTAGLLGSGRSTYSQAANLALNQTLVRSINTSLIALLPVAAILFIGSAVLGAGELQDLALVLFVGMLSGTYSSICIATPVLADLKEREPSTRRWPSGWRCARPAAGRPAARRPRPARPPAGAAPVSDRSGRRGGAAACRSRRGSRRRPAAASEPGDAGDRRRRRAGRMAARRRRGQASAPDRVPAGQGTSRAPPAPAASGPGPGSSRGAPRGRAAPGGKEEEVAGGRGQDQTRRPQPPGHRDAALSS